MRVQASFFPHLLFLAFALCAPFVLFAQETEPPVALRLSDERLYGGSGHEAISTALALEDGGFLLCGTSQSPKGGDKSADSLGQSDFWIVRTDSAGEILWDKTLGGESGENPNAAAAALDSGFLIAGMSRSGPGPGKAADSLGKSDGWVVRLDSDGTVLWDKTYGGPEIDGFDTAVRLEDGWLIGGSTRSENGPGRTVPLRGQSDFWLVEIDDAGEVRRDTVLGGAGNDRLYKIVPEPGDGWWLVGSSDSDAGFEKTQDNRGRSDLWVVRIGPNWRVRWDRALGGSRYEFLIGNDHAARLTDGSLIIYCASDSPADGDKTTETNSGSFNFDYWLIKLRPDGTKAWDIAPQLPAATGSEFWSYTFLAYKVPLFISSQENGRFLIAGLFQRYDRASSERTLDRLFFQYDSLGRLEWREAFEPENYFIPELCISTKSRGVQFFGSSSARDDDPDDGISNLDFWTGRVRLFSAGKDTFLCKPGSVRLEGYWPNENAAYAWQPEELLFNPRSPSPVALPVRETTRFTLAAYKNDTVFARDEVWVRVAESRPALRAALKRDAFGSENGVVLLSAKGGAPPYQYKIEPMDQPGAGGWQTDRVFRDLSSGTYVARIRDENNCAFETTITVD